MAASATADREDMVPAAIRQAGGRVERVGMPVDTGNRLCLGWLRRRAVIGLPSCELIGRAHVWNQVTNAHLVCRLLLEKKRDHTNNENIQSKCKVKIQSL